MFFVLFFPSFWLYSSQYKVIKCSGFLAVKLLKTELYNKLRKTLSLLIFTSLIRATAEYDGSYYTNLDQCGHNPSDL